MSYSYLPHNHFKIWLSKDPDKFLNPENQIRMMTMRIRNPKDIIHFVYDSSLLNDQARKNLQNFCEENNFIPFDIHAINPESLSTIEQDLLRYYQDEIKNLNTGGNLAVASDILRWLSPVFKLGNYTDFDVPVDTSQLPETMLVDAPLLLNIGSLELGFNELIISNNDFISVVDAKSAEKYIHQIQKGIAAALKTYHTDFIEQSTKKLGSTSFLHARISHYMKNRAEAEYIQKSQDINNKDQRSSLELRAFIHKITSNQDAFLSFNRISPEEKREAIIKRLRKNLSEQLNLIKRLFFKQEYFAIYNILQQNDDKFLTYLMKRERSLYIKSIVVCTTGPIQIAKSLFGDYVINSSVFKKKVNPFSFNHYNLKQAFQSKNSVSLHETAIGMLRFLGTTDGELNDSSWLEEGQQLQKIREEKILKQREELLVNLPYELNDLKIELKKQIKSLNHQAQDELQKFLNCFDEDRELFDLDQFRALYTQAQTHKFFAKKSQDIIQKLEALCTEAQVKLKIKNAVTYKSRPPCSVQHQKNPHFLMLVINTLLLLPRIIGLLISRGVGHLVLAPDQVTKQRPIHHVAMSDNTALDQNDLVVVNLIPYASKKKTNDIMLKLRQLMGFGFEQSSETYQLHLNNRQDKQHIDNIIREIYLLITRQSKAKRCEGKAFTWDKIHFKGIELLDEPLRAYFFNQLKAQYGALPQIPRQTQLDFFTLKTQDNSVLDSVAIVDPGEEKKPMHERKFVIKCLAREQNYINWIKDGTYSAQKIGATVIAFNYRGIDYSRGMVCTQNDMVNDTIAQVDRLLALGVKARNIGIEGDGLGGAVATLAAAQLHERDDKVKLHNSRSFRSIPRFLIGYFLPHTQSNWTEPMTWLRYIAAGFSLIFLSPIIWLSGWRFNAVNAWDKIPVADKDYSVVRANEHVQYRTPEQTDGIIHDHWASIASYLDEQRQTIQAKRKCGKSLTIEEQKILQDKPEKHYFKPAACKPNDQGTKELFKAHGKFSYFLPHRHIVSITNPEETNHDYMAKQFKLRFQ